MEHEGKKYLYYTSHSDRTCLEDIGLAMTEDNMHYEKLGRPVLSPDPKYYISRPEELNVYVHASPRCVDCRDMCVVKDPKGNGWWGYFAARVFSESAVETSVIGLAHSDDLIHWTQLPPCFAPKKFACIEVPDVYEMDGKWWMTVLTGNGYGQRNRMDDPYMTCGTICAVADSPEGPFVLPEESTVMGSCTMQGNAVKSLMFEGERYLFWTQVEKGAPLGSVSLPSKAEVRRGHIVPCWNRWLDTLIGGERLDMLTEAPIENTGRWGTVASWEQKEDGIYAMAERDWSVRMYERTEKDFVAEACVIIGDARSVGFVFHAPGERASEKGYVFLLDVEKQETQLVWLYNFQMVERRRWKIDRNRELEMKLIVLGRNIYLYLDGELVHQLNDDQFEEGKFGLMVEAGGAVFTQAKVYEVNG